VGVEATHCSVLQLLVVVVVEALWLTAEIVFEDVELVRVIA
jgi:hypothetical protein